MIDYRLSKGSHATREDGQCSMEWVSYIAGEPHSDAPKCVCPALRRFGIAINDYLPDDLCQQLRPYLARMIGTAGDGRTQERLYMMADWAVRVAAAEAMEVSDEQEWADKLRAVEPVMDQRTADAAERVVHAAADAATATDAAAANATAYSAYSANAAADAANANAANAANAAADAAHAAANAADDAAYSANAAAYAAADARQAMWTKLLPSILELLDRMLPTEHVPLPEPMQREYEALLSA